VRWRALQREHASWADGFAMQVLAAADAAEGELRKAVEWLDGCAPGRRRASDAADARGYRSVTAADRRALGGAAAVRVLLV
jgi:hypothetical protein